MSNLLKSRKYWGAVVGVILVVLRQFLPQFPVSDEAITNLVYLIVAYIIGTGLEDSSLFEPAEPLLLLSPPSDEGGDQSNPPWTPQP